MQYVLKVALTAAVVVAVAEIAKRNTLWAAALASLPLTSVLAFVWLYVDTGDTAKVASLSSSVFWLVLPSLVLVALLPPLLRIGWGFWWSLLASALATAAAYAATVWLLGRIWGKKEGLP
jgi:hypothetical protein